MPMPNDRPSPSEPVDASSLEEEIAKADVNGPALERLLGLATLTIQNAMGTPEYIPGLDAQAAETFRDSILSRIKH